MTENTTIERPPHWDRFWGKVDASGDCWEWQGIINWRGYGRIKVRGRFRQAHREAYELLVGPIPKGLTIDHLCRNRSCVNPDHLEPVTSRENLLRSPITQASKLAGRTHCNQRHPYNEENTFIRRDGSRGCRECRKQRLRRYRQRLKEAT